MVRFIFNKHGKYAMDEMQNLLDAGHFAAALDCCDELISKDPDDIHYTCTKGRILMMMERYQEAAIIMCELFKQVKSPEIARLYVSSVICTRKYDDALKLAEKAILDFPAYLPMRSLRADILSNLGQYDKAEKALYEILQIQPDFTDAMGCIARIYMDKHDYDNALKTCDKILRLDEKDDMGLYYKAESLYELGYFKESHDYLVKADKYLHNYNILMARILNKLDRNEEALHILSGETRSAAVLLTFADIYFTLGKNDLALKCQEEALGIDPNVHDLKQYMARLVKLDRLRMAFKCCKVLEHAEDPASAWIFRALIRNLQDLPFGQEIKKAKKMAGVEYQSKYDEISAMFGINQHSQECDKCGQKICGDCSTTCEYCNEFVCDNCGCKCI